jgi:hypothetical protein
MLLKMINGLALYWASVFFVMVLICDHTVYGMGGRQDKLDVDKLIEQVNSEGAVIVINSLYSDDEVWQLCLDNIATANHKWIQLAVLLRPHSDAGISNMLDSAIGEAIEISPEKVFQLTQNVFKLNQICGSPDIDNNKYSTYEKAEATVERRIESVKKVDNKALIKLRDGCIKELETSIPKLKHYFETK